MEKHLIYNSVICLQCSQTLVSRHRHDFQQCSCENGSFTDGGYDYQRWGGKDLEAIQSHCIYDDEPFEVIRFYLERGTYGVNSDEELKYVKLKDISNEWLENIITYETERSGKFLKIYKTEVKYRKKNGKVIQKEQ